MNYDTSYLAVSLIIGNTRDVGVPLRQGVTHSIIMLVHLLKVWHLTIIGQLRALYIGLLHRDHYTIQIQKSDMHGM